MMSCVMSFHGMVSGIMPPTSSGLSTVGGSSTFSAMSMLRSRSSPRSMVWCSSHSSNCGVTSVVTV